MKIIRIKCVLAILNQTKTPHPEVRDRDDRTINIEKFSNYKRV